jgi:hypothetical protein
MAKSALYPRLLDQGLNPLSDVVEALPSISWPGNDELHGL